MLVYQTERLKEVIEQPTQLDIERIIDRRSRVRSFHQENKLKRLEAGRAGEQVVLEYLQKYGNEDWVVIQNMWLSNGGPFEADFILLTNHGPYLFEVKNYTSDFVYQNGIVSFNSQIAAGDPIYQTRRNQINLEKICQLHSRQLQVKGALLLVGIDNYTEIHSEVEDIDIVIRTHLRHYIQKIAEKDRVFQGYPMNKKQVTNQLERFEINGNYGPEIVSKDILDGLIKGIQCPFCDGFDVKINRKVTYCPCGFKEDREIVILRTICEFGVLTFDKHLRIGELLEFFDGKISRDSLRQVLTKYFQEIKKNRYSYFINLKLPLHKLYEKLNIVEPVSLKMTYQEFEQIIKEL